MRILAFCIFVLYVGATLLMICMTAFIICTYVSAIIRFSVVYICILCQEGVYFHFCCRSSTNKSCY